MGLWRTFKGDKMKITMDLGDYEFEEEVWDVCRDYIASYTNASELCDIGQAIDLKFNLTSDVVAEEIRIRNFWKDKDYEIKDTLADNMFDEFEKREYGEIDFRIKQRKEFEISNKLLDDYIDEIIYRINYHRGYDDSNVEYKLSEELDELFEEIVNCLEKYDIEKAYELSKEI